MNKVAVLVAEGFEEGETFTIVDIMRRLGICCDTVYFDEKTVQGMHGMRIECDRRFSGDMTAYDVVVLPGGRPGGENLCKNQDVIRLVQAYNKTSGKYIAAMCSGTTVLARAGVIKGKKMTGYTGYAEKLPGACFLNDVVVTDQNLITSQGPATPYPFAYAIAEALGIDTKALRCRMLYDLSGGR